MSSIAIFALLLTAVLLFVLVCYYWLRLRGAKATLNEVKQRHRDIRKKPANAVTAMYKPKNIGEPTDKRRVFITSKGLKSYRVNQYGFPLPEK